MPSSSPSSKNFSKRTHKHTHTHTHNQTYTSENSNIERKFELSFKKITSCIYLLLTLSKYLSVIVSNIVLLRSVFSRRLAVNYSRKTLHRRCLIDMVFRPETVLKKTLWRRCFPVNFAKFRRTPFLQNKCNIAANIKT